MALMQDAQLASGRRGGEHLADVEAGDTSAAATLNLIIHRQEVDGNIIRG